MNNTIYKVISLSKVNWRMCKHLTSQGNIYPREEVESGMGIEVLMVGSDIEGEVSGEVLEDPMVLLEGDLTCGTAMVYVPS